MTQIFSTGEIHRRWSEIWRRSPKCDCMVVPSFHNSYYLSGLPVVRYGRWAISVIWPNGDANLVLPDFEVTAAERISPISDLRPYRDDDGPTVEVVVRRLR